MTDTEPPVRCVAGKYVLHEKLGCGSFGQVWHGAFSGPRPLSRLRSRSSPGFAARAPRQLTPVGQ